MTRAQKAVAFIRKNSQEIAPLGKTRISQFELRTTGWKSFVLEDMGKNGFNIYYLSGESTINPELEKLFGEEKAVEFDQEEKDSIIDSL